MTISSIRRYIWADGFHRHNRGLTAVYPRALTLAELYRVHFELEHAPNTDAILDALIQGAQEAWHNC